MRSADDGRVARGPESAQPQAVSSRSADRAGAERRTSAGRGLLVLPCVVGSIFRRLQVLEFAGGDGGERAEIKPTRSRRTGFNPKSLVLRAAAGRILR